MVRCRLDNGILLSVPLVGGASVSKRLRAGSDATDLRLSDHGKWRREHLGAFSAIYGRTPYFIHLFPGLERIYHDSESDDSFLAFAEALRKLTESWISDYPVIERESVRNEAVRLRRMELKTKVNTDLSIFDAIFRFGKETALCL